MEKIDITVEKIIQTLKNNHHTISFAESCTGGRVASAFTAMSGVSSVLNGSCITYSNDIKEDWLGVTHKVLEAYGAVSSQCVSQMLDGIIKMAQADYAIAISGIAGPTGGTPLKPVGRVYIGIKTPYLKEIFECNFRGSRQEVQSQATHFAIEKLAKILNI